MILQSNGGKQFYRQIISSFKEIRPKHKITHGKLKHVLC